MRRKGVLATLILVAVGILYLKYHGYPKMDINTSKISGFFSKIMEKLPFLTSAQTTHNYIVFDTEIQLDKWNGYMKVSNTSFKAYGIVNSIKFGEYPIDVKPINLHVEGKIDSGIVATNKGKIIVSGILENVDVGGLFNLEKKSRVSIEFVDTKTLSLNTSASSLSLYHFSGKLRITEYNKTNELVLNDEKTLLLDGVKQLSIEIDENKLYINGTVEKIKGSSFVYGG